MNIGIYGTTSLHFITCGLPFIIAIVNTIVNSPIELPFKVYFSKNIMVSLLILSGILLAISFVMYFKNCNCDLKNKKTQKITLIICSAMYILAILGHFININKETLCH
jgi:peptidoglycan biosynthesis protein MviN/MurJ (putative lipid II flippase)